MRSKYSCTSRRAGKLTGSVSAVDAADGSFDDVEGLICFTHCGFSFGQVSKGVSIMRRQCKTPHEHGSTDDLEIPIASRA